MLTGLFGRSRRTPAEVTRVLREALRHGRATREDAAADDRARDRASEEISRSLRAAKDMLSAEPPAAAAAAAAASGGAPGPPQSPPPPPAPGAMPGHTGADNVAGLVALARRTDLLLTIAGNLELMEFEARKDAVQVFNNLVRRGLSNAGAGADAGQPNRIVVDARQILECLVAGYENADVALNCGPMLRECLRSEMMARVLVESPKFWRFFDLVELSDFDVASDAFASFKEALTRHSAIAAAFMERNLDQFVTSYNLLLRSQNYVTRRQSLKLLSEMLVVRANFKIMTSYIASPTNLRLIMNLLLDQRRNIQFEAFHVFKVFVANPKKTADVRQILLRNKDRLLSYLNDFLRDRPDEQFQVDRNHILEEIRSLTAASEAGVA